MFFLQPLAVPGFTFSTLDYVLMSFKWIPTVEIGTILRNIKCLNDSDGSSKYDIMSPVQFF